MNKGDKVIKRNGKPFTRNGSLFAEFVEMTPNNNVELLRIVTVKEEDQCLTGHDPKSVISLKDLIDKAQTAFWAEVIKQLPSIQSGDLEPLTVAAFDDACETVLVEWIEQNAFAIF